MAPQAQPNGFWSFADQLVRSNYRFFFYGPPGSGKTHICASFPAPVFIFPENENSEETIRGLPYPYRKVSSMREMEEVLQFLTACAQRGQLGAQTVIVESLTHYQRFVELELEGPKGLDWQAYNRHFKRIQDVLWALPCHVVLTALSITTATKNGQVSKAGVDLPGKTANLFPASCDLVAYTEMQNGPVWLAHVQQFGLYTARTRIRGMPHGTYRNFSFGEHIAPYIGGQGVAPPPLAT